MPAVNNLSNALKTPESSESLEPLSLLLGIPWLYSVNAQLSICHSKIEVGDPEIGEAVCAVVGPELVYCHDHNLLMYSKGILPESMASVARQVPSHLSPKEESSSSDSYSSEESEDDSSDVEDPDFP